jgi:RNA polymerase sigma factor (sigma-70 family)
VDTRVRSEEKPLFGSPARRRQQEELVDTGSQPYDEPAPDQATHQAGVPTWEEIVDRHSDRVYRLALRLTGNRHDAEDLTQEVFVRVFRSLSTYTPGTFEGWIHRITTNLFLDQARRKQRIRFDALSDERAGRLHSDLPTPDTAYADTTFDDDIERALSTLPPEFRAAVALCDVEGLSYEEIAQILDAKLGTVRSRIHRGRAMLRTALAHRAPVEGRTRVGGPAAQPHGSAQGSAP